MTRLIGPDEASREVRTIDSQGRFIACRNRTATLYLDEAATVLADILTYPGGVAYEGSTVPIDAYSMLPLIQFPDGVDVLYVVVDGGPAWPVYARTDDRLDALAVSVAAAQATADAAQAAAGAAAGGAADRVLGNLTNAGTARTNLGLTSTATLPAGAASGAATLDAAARLPVDQLTAGWDGSPFRPNWPLPSTILTTLQTGHGWSNNAGSTLTTDTTDFILGSQSVRITTGGAGAQANLSRTGMTSFDARGKAIRLRFKVADVTNMAEIGCFLGSSNFVNFYKWSIQVTGTSKFVQSGEWVVITLNWHDATTAGSPNRAALTDARFYVIDNSAGQVQVNWQSFELIPDGSQLWPDGVISICFDDIYASQWTGGKPGLDARGWPATCHVIGDYVGNAGRLTLAQLQAMQDQSGWEIAGHANTGVNHSASYTGLTAAQLEADIRAQHSWLMAKGFRNVDGTAYPLGQFGLTSDAQSTRDIVRGHWGYARTTHGRTKETVQPADPWRLRAVSGISTFSGGYAPSALTTAVTGDIAKCKANRSWLILVFHDIVAGAPTATSQITQTDYDAILAAIAAAGIPVRTVSEVLRGATAAPPVLTTTSTLTGDLNVTGGALRVTGAAGTTRQMQFTGPLSDNLAPDGSTNRWSVQADNTTESGSSVGSDFRIVRHADNGTVIDTPLFVKRSNGYVGVNNTSPAARLDVITDGTIEAIVAKATAAGTASIGVVSIQTAAAGKRAFDFRVTGDSVSRFRLDTSAGGGSGTLTFGDGTTADVTLYRGGVDLLQTDDSLTVGGTLLVSTGGTAINAVNRGGTGNFGAYVLRTAGVDRWSIQMTSGGTHDLFVSDSANGTTGLLVEARATAPNISLLTSSKSYGGGIGVLFVANANTVPSSNPVGGGLLYVEAGALKYRGSSGNVAVLAAA